MPQKLIQTQTQTQTLTPQQLLQVSLLELPLSDLEQRVSNELLDNEALERGDTSDEKPEGENDYPEGENDPDFLGDGGAEALHNEATRDALADYISSDDTPDYLLKRVQQESEGRERVWGESVSFYDRLLAQVGEYDLSPKEEEILRYLIGSLDQDGLLRKDLSIIAGELSVYQGVETSEEEILSVLRVLQKFEPTGLGARSLQECLRLQLVSSDYKSPLKEKALQVIDRCYDDFTGKRWDKIKLRLHLSDEETRQLRDDLRRLNPRPLNTLGEDSFEAAQAVIPDFRVERDANGLLYVEQNGGELPSLCVSRSFRDTLSACASSSAPLSSAQRAAYVYARRKVEAAEGFIHAVKERRRTLQLTMEAILSWQHPFFEEGDETLLRPMVLRDIAARTGLDISTISRVSNSKFVETEWGVFPLKYFFNDKIKSAAGEEHSTLKVRSLLRELIEGEDKSSPLTDEALTEMLRQKGIPVARRTVAKYREQLGLPVARLRK